MRLFSNDKYLKIYISSSLIIIIISLWIAEVRKAAWPGDGGGQRSHRKEGKKERGGVSSGECCVEVKVMLRVLWFYSLTSDTLLHVWL